MEQPSITCPRCNMTSYNPNDIRYGYCGNCHWWTSDPLLADFVPGHEIYYRGKPTLVEQRDANLALERLERE